MGFPGVSQSRKAFSWVGINERPAPDIFRLIGGQVFKNIEENLKMPFKLGY